MMINDERFSATDRPRRRRLLVVAWAGLTMAGLMIGACGGKTKEPKTLPSQTVSQVSPELEAPPPLPPPSRLSSPLPPPAVKVIDPGESEPQPKTLIEASRLAKARKSAKPPVAEINDDNLHEYASGGQVIIMETPPAGARVPPTAPSPTPRSGASTIANGALDDQEVDTDSETYWRDRGLELRRNWRDAFEKSERLELLTASLRQRFYAEDDPYVRDGQIKPAWDRALDRLRELEDEMDRYRAALDEFIDEGHQLDIPPGWLNDGWELEPSAEERRDAGGFGSVAAPIDVPLAADEAKDIDSGGGSPR